MTDLAAEAGWPRERLDRDYSARGSVTAEVFDAAMAAYRSTSDAVRPDWLTSADVVYDEASGQAIDVYGTKDGELRPVFLFIHGGYWRMLSKAESAFMAAPLGENGIATAVVDYRLSPAVGLDEIVREVRAAVAYLWTHGESLGIDRNRIYVGGSSAGGHLTGAVLSGGWQRQFRVPEDVVKGAMPISGLFHLAPISRSFVQEWLNLPDDQVAPLSPAENTPTHGCPIIVAYAAGEPDGFKRQSAEYDRLWRGAGFESRLMEIPGRNHFDVLLDLADGESLLLRTLVDLIRGTR